MATPTYTQAQRQIEVQVPSLGKDVLLLAAFSGREEMSRLFHFELDLLSTKQKVEAKDVVGKPVGFRVMRADGQPRWFHGRVSRFSGGGLYVQGLRQYRAEVVPWLWFLTRTADCRIFQKMTVKDIIEKIFKDLGFADYDLKLKGNHPKREYCVQYRETDFAFVSRLMEEEGIFYFFKHEEKKHTLVIRDEASGYEKCDESQVNFASGSLVPNHVNHWSTATSSAPASGPRPTTTSRSPRPT